MEQLDVLVVGGGITGVGIAQFAAAAGYRVALWEKAELGSATSANSSKLIHGGLRYLETGQLSLVRRCLKQRRQLLNLAPALVKPVPFYIPVYHDSRRGAITITAGLGLYALLSELDPMGRFSRLASGQWPRFNGLKQTGLQHVFQYWDAQTDDQLLTRAVAASAASLGAVVCEQTQCDAIYLGAHCCQVTGRGAQGEPLAVRSQMVVNACGPWVNELLARVTPAQVGIDIDWVQGSHLLLDIPPPDGVLYLESPLDNRVIFVIPWQGQTLLGTTEVMLPSLTQQPSITDTELRYLLQVYGHYFSAFSQAELQSRIVRHFCGIRVLPHGGDAAFSRPRETLLHATAGQPRLLSVYGGKLTEFRETAAQALAHITQQLGPRQLIADVDRLPIGQQDDPLAETG
ncbi:FAD-dependent oxidoreductase [Shewanella sp. NFH-SH190041]|uniref:glycerol-3-phosphate dehydrogenase/oxidase n=1 Tax=Shewanella sp. NFH-SH190041 TaxID=2950245 RepID=UPI0021C4BAE2|nr:FAD-dependent oxidoreductase [Shewanella sp. NFH-SH190041]BDM63320.1 FAD-dependent oxidoreductase [Shewanella sp. NFH-SH190041]